MRQCPVSVVVDHMALIAGSSYRYGDSTNIQLNSYLRETKILGLQMPCRAPREGILWIKVSAPYRCSNLGPQYEDLRWVVRRFVDVNSKDVLWGSDWPHTQKHEDRVGRSQERDDAFLEVDNRAWIEVLSTWFSEEKWQLMWIGNQLLCMNIRRLFSQIIWKIGKIRRRFGERSEAEGSSEFEDKTIENLLNFNFHINP